MKLLGIAILAALCGAAYWLYTVVQLLHRMH